MIAWLRNNLKFELQIFTRIVLKNKLDLKLGRHAFAGVAAESFIAVGVDPARFDLYFFMKIEIKINILLIISKF